ncbi:MAG: hypothetical protein NVS1B13_05900 [Flavisolibacter sp.]
MPGRSLQEIRKIRIKEEPANNTGNVIEKLQFFFIMNCNGIVIKLLFIKDQQKNNHHINYQN